MKEDGKCNNEKSNIVNGTSDRVQSIHHHHDKRKKIINSKRVRKRPHKSFFKKIV